MKNMSKGLLALVVVGLFALSLLGWMVGGYNNLVGQRNNVDNALAKVESAYQRRFDLVPALVESVKGSQLQEQKVFGDLANARANYSGASNSEERVAAAGQFDSALSRLLVVVENYPELTSNQNVQNLMVQLEGSENRIKVERDNYSQVATTYNTAIQKFPRNIVAAIFGFDKKPLYTAQQEAENMPEVDFTPEENTQSSIPSQQSPVQEQ